MSYVLTKLITNNITSDSLWNFLVSVKMHSDYVESGKDYENYFTDIINEGKLSLEKFNDYLFNELFYGKQRDTFIYKIHSYNNKINQEEKLKEIMKANYGIDDIFYNKLATTYFSNDDEKKELVAFKIVKNLDGSVAKIKLIFGYKVEVLDSKDRKRNEHSYVPIEINLKENIVIIKVSPKARVIHDRHKPESLFKKYKDKVFSLYNISTNAFNYSHKETLYRMCEDLYSQIYEKMVSTKPSQVDDIINNASNELVKILKIQDLEIKKVKNNIFDIGNNLNRFVEHILISDIICSKKAGEDVDGVDGFVTYLRFNDGNNVSARLRGENCKAPIFDSETYMALRSPIDSTKKISVLQVLWFNNRKDLRISYDTNSSEFLNIHYFKNLNKRDFDYGYSKYTEYESRITSNVCEMGQVNDYIAVE